MMWMLSASSCFKWVRRCGPISTCDFRAAISGQVSVITDGASIPASAGVERGAHYSCVLRTEHMTSTLGAGLLVAAMGPFAVAAEGTVGVGRAADGRGCHIEVSATI